MSKESVLNLIEVCPVCRTSYIPENGEICKCDEEREKQLAWHNKLTEFDHV